MSGLVVSLDEAGCDFLALIFKLLPWIKYCVPDLTGSGLIGESDVFCHAECTVLALSHSR